MQYKLLQKKKAHFLNMIIPKLDLRMKHMHNAVISWDSFDSVTPIISLPLTAPETLLKTAIVMPLQQQISNMWGRNYANIAGYGCQAENLVIHITAVSEMTVMLHWNRRWNAFSDDRPRGWSSQEDCVIQSAGVMIRLKST